MLARLVVYGGSAAATLRLRSHASGAPEAKPATFVAPLGPTAPIVAMCVCAALAAGATRDQLIGGAAALMIGALFFAAARRRN